MDRPIPNGSVVQLKNVTKRIGKRTIIDNLSLDLPEAEVFGFLGPNGSGKTTTIRMMVGLMALTDGDVIIRGHSIRTEYEKAIRHVGAIVENPEMYKYMSGYQNLLHFSRMIPGITRQRIDEVVDLVGLKGRINDKVRTYSLGMRQRLGVAQAIMHKPSLLILDEPTNGLDPAGIRELRDYLRKLAKNEGITVFVSSHLLSEMELMCDRVAIIQAGKLIDVQSVRQAGTANDASAVSTVVFEVDQEEGALQLLQGRFGVKRSEGGLTIEADRDTVAAVNAELVQQGIKVYSIRVLSKTLEDQFLEITGGESVV
ncbi:ABC-2 type transport system ATP-binding protein [Paenibacillus phyllosphaerae]|uniref:ABC-2 type transport system ATP-binding protein n=1 Tax=Paenibacillus phyllosphaerae TaxID=274593 RepID=A0A7W5ATU1_9BACL|nr:ABC transporter ATP-binding protein [Paenibacillus phyllosphaerae]MBB3108547.1 ABC-2 type transport system ATP-binding protein [Paenibacillus phyllosphaerae]